MTVIKIAAYALKEVGVVSTGRGPREWKDERKRGEVSNSLAISVLPCLHFSRWDRIAEAFSSKSLCRTGERCSGRNGIALLYQDTFSGQHIAQA